MIFSIQNAHKSTYNRLFEYVVLQHGLYSMLVFMHLTKVHRKEKLRHFQFCRSIIMRFYLTKQMHFNINRQHSDIAQCIYVGKIISEVDTIKRQQTHKLDTQKSAWTDP